MSKKEEKPEKEMSNKELTKEMGTSRFEKQVIKNLEEGENLEKVANRAYRKAVATVTVQIANLKSRIVQTEADIEDARDFVQNSMFSDSFELGLYDRNQEKLETLENDLEDLNHTLKNREELLVQWA